MTLSEQLSAEEKHNKLRDVLIENNNVEFGDCIIDDISRLFGCLTTIDIADEFGNLHEIKNS